MKETNTTHQKIKVLQKLFDNGIKTEKELSALTTEKILCFPGITITELKMIMALQQHTKANKLFSYLGGDVNEQATK